MNSTTARGLLPVLFAALCAAAIAPVWADDDYPERRAEIASLTRDQQKELLDNQERFQSLDTDEQQKLRELHGELETHEQRDELKAVMHAYCDWVRTLSPLQRAELAGLAPEERIAKVKEYMEHQQSKPRHGFWGMGKPMVDWLVRFADDHRQQLAQALPPPAREAWLTEFERRRSAPGSSPEESAIRMLIRWHVLNPNQDLPLTDDDLQLLETAVPRPLRERIEWDISRQAKPAPDDKRLELARQIVRLLVAGHLFFGPHDQHDQLCDEADLEAFAASGLAPRQREFILGESGERYHRRLLGFYVLSKMPGMELSSFGGGMPGRSVGGPRGGPPGRGPSMGSGPGRGPGGMRPGGSRSRAQGDGSPGDRPRPNRPANDQDEQGGPPQSR